MKKIILLLILPITVAFGQLDKKKFFFLLQNTNTVDPNIALGNTFLTTNAKSRAYWDFTTQLTGVEDAAITSVADLRGNGWDLGNFSGAATPVEGKIQVGLTEITTLNAFTPSGTESALVGTSAATNLLKNSVEVHLLVNLFDGQPSSALYLFGCSNGGTQYFRLGVNTSGNLTLEYAAAGAGLSTLTSSGNALINGLTGVTLIRLICDFSTDVISGYVNGVPISFSLSSGNAVSSWNPANWVCSKGVGVGGHWDSVFTNDTGTKHILKCAVTDLITNDESIQIAASFLNY
jgi:hypothetical protein